MNIIPVISEAKKRLDGAFVSPLHVWPSRVFLIACEQNKVMLMRDSVEGVSDTFSAERPTNLVYYLLWQVLGHLPGLYLGALDARPADQVPELLRIYEDLLKFLVVVKLDVKEN